METCGHGPALLAAALAKGNQRVEFVLAGGVLLHQSAYAAEVSRRLRRARKSSLIRLQERPGEWGAVEMAIAAKGKSLSAAANYSKALTFKALTTPPPDPGPVPVEVLAQSPTEQRNPRSMKLDTMSLSSAIRLMLSWKTPPCRAKSNAQRKISCGS